VAGPELSSVDCVITPPKVIYSARASHNPNIMKIDIAAPILAGRISPPIPDFRHAETGGEFSKLLRYWPYPVCPLHSSSGKTRYPFLKKMAASVTGFLDRLRQGDRTAFDPLVAVVYPELHRIAAGYMRDEHASHVLQPTALVHEAYLRLVQVEQPNYENRAHFFGTIASIMRQVLVDHARASQAAKRGGQALTLALDDALDATPQRQPTVVAVDDALRSLAAIDENKARLVELRFFGGLTAEEIAEFQAVSVHRVRHEMRLALAWLHREVTS
jgi:RNA polymerase sigma-70 factor, ECF subfamily